MKAERGITAEQSIISPTSWCYEEAFSRNVGLISPEEQQRLRRTRVAIVGMGGVGGVHAVTFARLGVGAFTIADPDIFTVTNTNRQYGATVKAMGRSKVEVMAEVLRDINPEVDVRIIREPLCADNVQKFFQDANLFVDGIDFFELDTRRLLFRIAAEQGLYSITAAPLGFSTAWLVFAPQGMSFDRYFDFCDAMEPVDIFAAFLVGLAPRGTHRTYMSMTFVDIAARTGPSSGLACQLAASVVVCEALKIILGRGPVRAAPWYQQFDSYLGRFVQGRLIGGNRNPVQRLKRWIARRWIRELLRSRTRI